MRCPELLMIPLLCEQLMDHESVIVHEAVEFNLLQGRKSDVVYKGINPAASTLKSSLRIAMIDALPSFFIPRYTTEAMVRNIAKAVSSFSWCRPSVATGNWGCGTKKADVQLMFTLQWIAASYSNCYLHFCPDGHPQLDRMNELVEQVYSKGWTIKDMFYELLEFSGKQVKDAPEEDDLFSHLLQSTREGRGKNHQKPLVSDSRASGPARKQRPRIAGENATQQMWVQSLEEKKFQHAALEDEAVFTGRGVWRYSTHVVVDGQPRIYVGEARGKRHAKLLAQRAALDDIVGPVLDTEGRLLSEAEAGKNLYVLRDIGMVIKSTTRATGNVLLSSLAKQKQQIQGLIGEKRRSAVDRLWFEKTESGYVSISEQSISHNGKTGWQFAVNVVYRSQGTPDIDVAADENSVDEGEERSYREMAVTKRLVTIKMYDRILEDLFPGEIDTMVAEVDDTRDGSDISLFDYLQCLEQCGFIHVEDTFVRAPGVNSEWRCISRIMGGEEIISVHALHWESDKASARRATQRVIRDALTRRMVAVEGNRIHVEASAPPLPNILGSSRLVKLRLTLEKLMQSELCSRVSPDDSFVAQSMDGTRWTHRINLTLDGTDRTFTGNGPEKHIAEEKALENAVRHVAPDLLKSLFA